MEQLQSRLKSVLPLATSFTGVGYRSSAPVYATEAELLTGEGSRLRGGRWNPIGIPAVYISLTPETAMAESFAHHRYYGVPVEDAMPRTFVAIETVLHQVLDLRDGRLRQRLQVSEERILAVDWRKEVQAGRQPVTQLIGGAAHAVGWEALIVPSAALCKQHNLLVFPDRLLSASHIRVQNAHRLQPKGHA